MNTLKFYNFPPKVHKNQEIIQQGFLSLVLCLQCSICIFKSSWRRESNNPIKEHKTKTLTVSQVYMLQGFKEGNPGGVTGLPGGDTTQVVI